MWFVSPPLVCALPSYTHSHFLSFFLFVQAHLRWGTILSRTGALDEAESHLREASRLAPDDVDVYREWGEFYRTQVCLLIQAHRLRLFEVLCNAMCAYRFTRALEPLSVACFTL